VRRARGPPPRRGAVEGGGDGQDETLRGGGARLLRIACAHVAAPERRLLLGGRLWRARHPPGLLHVNLRGGPCGGMGGPRARAVCRQPVDSSARRLRRAGRAGAQRDSTLTSIASSPTSYARLV